MKTKVNIYMHSMIGRGAEKILANILNKINEDKYEINLVLLEKKGEFLKLIPNYITIEGVINNKNKESFFDKLSRRIKLYFVCHFPNVSCTLGILPTPGDINISFLQWYTARLVNRINKKKFRKKIAWIHNDLSKTVGCYCSKNDFKTFDDICFVSEDAKKGYDIFNLNCKIQKHIIYNYINENEILEKSEFDSGISPCPSKINICCVGSLTNQKRHDILIQALGLLKFSNKYKKDFFIYLIGQGEDEKKLKQLAKDNDVEENIVFVGFDQNPYKYMVDCDIFALSSDYEGFGVVLVEAMILGKPVISTRCAGPTEILDNGKYGILVEHDVKSFYMGLTTLIDNLEEFSKKSLLGKNKILKKMDISLVEDLLDQ